MKNIFFYLTLFISPLSAQDVLFPELFGDDLLSKLVAEYKPNRVLNYSNAREYMFENLQLNKDTVEGVYTGFKIYLPDDAPSRIWTFERGINTEHIYPRSKGASDGNAFSDLHHLKPSKVNVNRARLNHPFKEIDDEKTDKWFRGSGHTFDIPNENINEFSELDSFVTSSGFIIGDFEPRESVKGDIARSVFYFFTIYNQESMSADPDYFESMQEDLCQWHVSDPADENEIRVTQLISEVQDGKVNPFVMDCTLAERSYCDNMNLDCRDNLVPTIELAEKLKLSISPNPSNGPIYIQNSSRLSQIYIYNLQGLIVYTEKEIKETTIKVDINLSVGVYHIVALDQKGRNFFGRLLIQN